MRRCATCAGPARRQLHCGRCTAVLFRRRISDAVSAVCVDLPAEVVIGLVTQRFRCSQSLHAMERWLASSSAPFRSPSYVGAPSGAIHLAAECILAGSSCVDQPCCGSCGVPPVLVGGARPGFPAQLWVRGDVYLCAPCLRRQQHTDADRPCDRCGRTLLKAEGGPFCPECRIPARVEILLRDAPASLQAIAPLLIAMFPSLAYFETWKQRFAGTLFVAMCQGTVEVSHAALDDALARQGVVSALGRTVVAIERLRALLIAAGTLPERDPHAAAFYIKAERQLARLQPHPSDAALVRAWIRDSEHGLAGLPAPGARVATARAEQVRSALLFLAQLRRDGVVVARASSPHVSTLIGEWGRSHHALIVPFARWLRLCGQAPGLSVPGPKTHDVRETLPGGQHERVVAWLRSTPSLPLEVRVTAALHLVYGVGLPALTALHCTSGDATKWRRIALEHAVLDPLLPWISNLLQLQSRAARERAFPGIDDPYLLGPAHLGGARQADAANLGGRLRQHDVPVRLGRNSAKANLAQADDGVFALLGTGNCISGALRWYQHTHGIMNAGPPTPPPWSRLHPPEPDAL